MFTNAEVKGRVKGVKVDGGIKIKSLRHHFGCHHFGSATPGYYQPLVAGTNFAITLIGFLRENSVCVLINAEYLKGNKIISAL